MRAAVLSTAGESPAYGVHPDPAPRLGTTLIRVTAAPVVPLDLLCATGRSYFGSPATPYVPGVQGVGRVERSETLPSGSRVWFPTSAGMAPGDGGLAGVCLVRDEDLVPIEEDLDEAAVAALGASAIAAYQALSARGALAAGEKVLVLGGGGAVGQAGIGVAQALGASRVVAVARSEDARHRAREAGADEGVGWGGHEAHNVDGVAGP